MVDHVSHFVIACILLPILLPLQLYYLRKFFLCRHHQIIAIRSVNLVALTELPSVLMSITVLLVLIVRATDDDLYPCFSNISSGVLSVSLAWVYVTRIWQLLCKFEITSKLAESVQSENFSQLYTGRGGWFLRHRSLMKTKFLVVVVFGIYAVAIAIGFALPLGFGCEELYNTYWTQFMMVAAVVLGVLMAFMLAQHGRDAFKLKVEFLWTAWFVVSGLVTWWILGRYDLVLGKQLSLEYGVIGMFYFRIVMPLRLLDQQEGSSIDFKGTKDIRSLEDLLSVKAGYDAFAKYLKREFASENLQFWSAVKEYRKAATAEAYLNPTKCLARSHRLYDAYVADESPYQVNLSDAIHTRLEQALAQQTERVNQLNTAASGSGAGRKSILNSLAVRLFHMKARTEASSKDNSRNSKSSRNKTSRANDSKQRGKKKSRSHTGSMRDLAPSLIDEDDNSPRLTEQERKLREIDILNESPPQSPQGLTSPGSPPILDGQSPPATLETHQPVAVVVPSTPTATIPSTVTAVSTPSAASTVTNTSASTAPSIAPRHSQSSRSGSREMTGPIGSTLQMGSGGTDTSALGGGVHDPTPGSGATVELSVGVGTLSGLSKLSGGGGGGGARPGHAPRDSYSDSALVGGNGGGNGGGSGQRSVNNSAVDSVQEKNLAGARALTNLFDEAQLSIFQILNLDVLPRFLSSTEFHEFVEAFNKAVHHSAVVNVSVDKAQAQAQSPGAAPTPRDSQSVPEITP